MTVYNDFWILLPLLWMFIVLWGYRRTMDLTPTAGVANFIAMVGSVGLGWAVWALAT